MYKKNPNGIKAKLDFRYDKKRPNFSVYGAWKLSGMSAWIIYG